MRQAECWGGWTGCVLHTACAQHQHRRQQGGAHLLQDRVPVGPLQHTRAHNDHGAGGTLEALQVLTAAGRGRVLLSTCALQEPPLLQQLQLLAQHDRAKPQERPHFFPTTTPIQLPHPAHLPFFSSLSSVSAPSPSCSTGYVRSYASPTAATGTPLRLAAARVGTQGSCAQQYGNVGLCTRTAGGHKAAAPAAVVTTGATGPLGSELAGPGLCSRPLFYSALDYEDSASRKGGAAAAAHPHAGER